MLSLDEGKRVYGHNLRSTHPERLEALKNRPEGEKKKKDKNSYQLLLYLCLISKNPHKGGWRGILKLSLGEVWNTTAIRHQVYRMEYEGSSAVI